MSIKTVGIIGGGQLGRMLAMAAGRLNFQTLVLDPQANCPAAQFCVAQIIAAYDDTKALERLARECDVITYEFENVPVKAAHFLETQTSIFPPSTALEISQDRLSEKQFFGQCAIPTAPYWQIDSEADLQATLNVNKGMSILKTRRLGYDGKGQVRIQGTDQAASAMAAIHHAPAILEGFVDFVREISVIAARGQSGEIEFFDIPENIHREGILRQSTLPAAIDERLSKKAQEHTHHLLEKLNYVGVIALEFFVTPQGDLIANEFAPRVHNSGHWTETACCVSQFEQHIRAICALPLVKPVRHSDCVMENLIGDDMAQVPELLTQEKITLHLYGKDEVRAGRKMGHFTRLI